MSFGRDPSQIRMALRVLRFLTFCVGLRCGPAETAFGNPHGRRAHEGLPFGARGTTVRNPPLYPPRKVDTRDLRYREKGYPIQNSLIEKRRNFCEKFGRPGRPSLPARPVRRPTLPPAEASRPPGPLRPDPRRRTPQNGPSDTPGRRRRPGGYIRLPPGPRTPPENGPLRAHGGPAGPPSAIWTGGHRLTPKCYRVEEASPSGTAGPPESGGLPSGTARRPTVRTARRPTGRIDPAGRTPASEPPKMASGYPNWRAPMY